MLDSLFLNPYLIFLIGCFLLFYGSDLLINNSIVLALRLNLDLMNLAGFCRNCLSKWYVKYAKEENYDLDYEESRKIIYGMAYSEWKSKYQSEATKEQIEQFKKNSLDD